ncbi:MAG: IgA Peptidase M64 [Bacteroidales bacterium]|jgi:hypothetical protein|nr:IgA Peptidase M64 [Bacteroidales bacterium]
MLFPKNLIPVAFLIVFHFSILSGQTEYKDFFEPKTLRFDFYLAGNAEQQHIYINCFREEPLWGGPFTHLTDHPGYGEYCYRIYDEASGKLIFQRGFNSLFQEWRTTDEAKTINRSYNQVILFPYPKNKIRLEILERNFQTGLFIPLFETGVDPNSMYINREKRPSYPITPILNNGESARKVDLVFVAEGYTKEEMDKFRKDVIRFSDYLFQTPPYSTRKKDFNIWAVECPSEESGVDIPGQNIWKNTTLNAHFYTFGIDRYLTAPDLSAIRDRIWNVSCDAVYVMVNSNVYGGGGIYNYYGLSTSDHALSEPVFVHEFGHSFAGLADEYFSAEVAYNDFYNLKNEPWEPNITTLVDFSSKWKDMLPPGIQIPTPDIKENKDKPGVYEGGGYLSKGIYRPMINCRMRTNHADFCPVCQKAINRMIDLTIDQ